MRKFKANGKSKRRRYKSGLKDNVRRLLGCSQDALATFLGIATPNLALVETDKRELPAKAILKRENLLKWIAEAETLGFEEPILGLKDLQKDRRTFHSRSLKLQLQISESKLKLSSMETRCMMHTDAFNRLNKMRKIEWGMALIPYPSWVNGLIAKNWIGLKKCDFKQQGLVRSKLAAMEAENAVLEMMIAELDNRMKNEFGVNNEIGAN